MNTLIQLKKATPVFLVALAYFALCPMAQPESQPRAADTALANGNTADGQLALASLATGLYNAAFGAFSLLSLTDAEFCTGLGAGALLSNDGTENTAIGAGALLAIPLTLTT